MRVFTPLLVFLTALWGTACLADPRGIGESNLRSPLTINEYTGELFTSWGVPRPQIPVNPSAPIDQQIRTSIANWQQVQQDLATLRGAYGAEGLAS